MKRWQKLIRFGLLAEARTLWRLMCHRDVPTGAKVTVALAIAYTVFPLDLIPDALPILGWLDDLTVLSGLVMLAYRMVPEALMEELRGRLKPKPVHATVH